MSGRTCGTCAAWRRFPQKPGCAVIGACTLTPAVYAGDGWDQPTMRDDDVCMQHTSIAAPTLRRRVFVASPLAPTETRTFEQNIAYARECTLDSISRGEAPFTPHLLYSQMLDDFDPGEREIGIECGMEFLRVAEALVVYEDHGVSRGMRAEIEAATAAGLRVERRRLL